MIFELLSVVAPVFVVALVGLAWARSGTHFDEESISRLVLNVGIPCLVFRTLTSLDVPPAELARMAGLAAGVMSMFAIGGFAALKVMNLPAHTYLGPLIFANSGNIGLPICLFAFGDAGLALGMAYFAVSSTCHVVLGGP
ncbi:MAG: AEC family transporter, partial [Deltaproteobacteria bacterium]|nr:AEC family transporter [Deltaproteobacteria bacterium]